MTLRRWIAIIAVLCLAACDDHGHTTSSPSSSVARRVSALRARKLPAPVRIRQQPQGATLTDPAFTALPDARAEYGRLGGSVYQIEVPDRWNGRLLLWMHGYAQLASELGTGPPPFREWLIAHGYAWGASSFSSTSLIPGRAADETAALWDHFVAKHGRPTWTYAAGASMGGWAAAIVAQRYANRFDGALGLCGAVGTVPAMRVDFDFFIAAAFVAGVTQAEFDAVTDLQRFFDERIKPVLESPADRQRFQDIVIDLTGGPRAFDREGLEREMATKWQRAGLLLVARLAPPVGGPYRLGPTAGVSSAEFNRNALIVPRDAAAFRAFTAGTEVTGRLGMPLLTMHTTGDEQVPINQALILRRRVHAAGRDRLLAQRVVKDPGHCGFSIPEEERAFTALVRWAEKGDRPATTNLAVHDLRRVAPTFELAPRRSATTTSDNVAFEGRAHLDGRPFDAQFIGAVVIDHGLVTPCNVTIPTIVAGRFNLAVYRATASAGCGRPGARVVFWTYAAQKLWATNPIAWPRRARARVTVDFATNDPSGATPRVLELSGEARHANGARVRIGARVEAFIGGTRCGVASVRGGVFEGYILHVVGPDSIAECRANAPITFRVDGRPAVETIANGGEPPHRFNLNMRAG